MNVMVGRFMAEFGVMVDVLSAGTLACGAAMMPCEPYTRLTKKPLRETRLFSVARWKSAIYRVFPIPSVPRAGREGARALCSDTYSIHVVPTPSHASFHRDETVSHPHSPRFRGHKEAALRRQVQRYVLGFEHGSSELYFCNPHLLLDRIPIHPPKLNACMATLPPPSPSEVVDPKSGALSLRPRPRL